MVKPMEIKGARVRLGLTQEHMASLIGKSVYTYQKKEAGKIKFFPDEIPIMARELNLSIEQTNNYFYDGKLPHGNK